MMLFLWGVLPVLAFIGMIAYLLWKISGGIDFFCKSIAKKRKRIMTIIGLIILLLPAVSVKATWVLVLLHFAVILLVMDLIAWLIHKIWKEKEFPILWKRLYRSGVIAALLTCAVFVYGTYNIYHVIQTDYTVETAKAIREDGYKILVVSDLHYGITLNQEQLQEEVTKMSGENADIVILDGDIVDESTTQTQMQEAFQTLGKIANKYGVYYVYGNHDQNNYTSHPNYGRDELADTIQQAGITILDDEVETINDEIALIGRSDKSDPTKVRKTISELTANLDSAQEWIVLDHQPTEYEEVENADCDMIVSGHTHGGQIWPAGLFAIALHLDDQSYGEETLNQLHAIVISGIAGWGFPLRTEKHSEYIVINLKPVNGK